jgi:hypothetical protein
MPSAILDPTGLTERPKIEGLTLAARRADLSGVKIGLLENGKQNAKRFLEDVATVMRDRYGAGEVQLRRKEIFSQPASPELVEELSSLSDVVVIGIGD